jgi:RNA polymerase sigma-70 factor (ECF subfamily)
LHPPDRELVESFLRNGDEDAFRQLFRRHTPRLYATALRLAGGQASQAEEAVQMAWARAARRLAGFEWRAALTTWLISIVINCVREQQRERRELPLEASHDVLTAVSAPGLKLDLERAIAALPPRYREVLVLHDVEGWTHAEIATALGITVGTTKSQLFHARRAVRARLGPRRAEVSHDA